MSEGPHEAIQVEGGACGVAMEDDNKEGRHRERRPPAHPFALKGWKTSQAGRSGVDLSDPEGCSVAGVAEARREHL